MSECVVRMEMPENCLICHLQNKCEIFCDWFDRFGTSEPRKPLPKPLDKGCRIITVLPDGHGRLVDADAIKLPKGFFEKVDNVPKFYEWLNSLPTIVTAEMRANDKEV